MLNASSTAPIHAKGLVAMDSDRTAGWEWTQYGAHPCKGLGGHGLG